MSLPMFCSDQMPKLLPEQSQARLEATMETAAALLEDIGYLREIVDKPDISRADIRRISAMLRRVLVEGDLLNIAGPRLGKRASASARQ